MAVAVTVTGSPPPPHTHNRASPLVFAFHASSVSTPLTHHAVDLIDCLTQCCRLESCREHRAHNCIKVGAVVEIDTPYYWRAGNCLCRHKHRLHGK
jgi:hypothetical protein